MFTEKLDKSKKFSRTIDYLCIHFCIYSVKKVPGIGQ